MATFRAPDLAVDTNLSDLIEHAIGVATLAPSVHNTQPWRLLRHGRALEVRADRQRQLHVLDPEGRLLVTSCGVLVHHLRVALLGVGLAADVALLPDPAQPDLLARLQISPHGPPNDHEVDDAVAELRRTTVRGRFSPDPLPDGLLERLRREVEEQGAVLREIRGDEVVEVQVLVDRAERYLAEDAAYQGELAAWVRSEPAEDGVPLEALDPREDRAELVVGRAFVPAVAHPSQDIPPVAEHPALVVLLTQGDRALDWLTAGQALSRLLLTCTENGVVAQPIGQVTDVPSMRSALTVALGVLARPQMLLRLGVGHGQPHAGRRPVADLLEVAAT